MATAEPITSVTAEQLADAEAKFKKALELRDTEVETAVELLGQVLEVRNKAFGENALECADTYLYYGECLFEQAQASSDFFGDQMKSAANQRAKAIAAAEEAGAEDAMEADAGDDADNGDDKPAVDEPASDKATNEAASSKQAEEAKGADDTTTTTTTTTTAGTPADTPTATEEAAEAAEQPTTAPAPPAEAPAAEDGASKETSAAAEVADAAAEGAEGADGGEGSAEEDGDSESSSDEDEGEEGEEGKAEGEEGAAAPEVTGESDDMVLAWEMLELARLIYNNNGGAEAHANKLADCHLYIGDILAEQEKFEAAVEEYKTAQEMLARLEGGHDAHRRRAAELEFKKATSLQLLDSPAEALAAMQSAKAHLSAHLEYVNTQISKAGSSGADVSGAVASAAFASILSGYASSAPAPAAADATAGEQSAELAKLHAQAADLKGTIESVGDRIEELTAAVEEHISMKEQLANIFKAVAAEGPSEQPGSSSGVVETVGFGGAGSSKVAGEVRDIGVIGKGRRVAPTPVSAEPPAAGGSAAAAAEAGAGVSAGQGEAADGAAKASAAGSGDVGVGKKRALSDLTSSDQEQAAEGDGADGAAAKVAAAATAAAEQPDAAPKKARV